MLFILQVFDMFLLITDNACSRQWHGMHCCSDLLHGFNRESLMLLMLTFVVCLNDNMTSFC